MVDVATRSPARLYLDELRFLVFGRAVPAVLFAVLGYRVLLNLLGQVRSGSMHLSVASVLEGPLPTALYLCFCAIPVRIKMTLQTT